MAYFEALLDFFPTSALSHWLLRGQMTSNNENVSRRNLRAVNSAKSMTSDQEGKVALLPANVDRRPPLQRGLMNFQLTLRFSGYKINCFPRD